MRGVLRVSCPFQQHAHKHWAWLLNHVCDARLCYVGTGAIFRTSHLRAVGGFTVGSITEDFDTAMSLHSHGFKTAFINQVGDVRCAGVPW